MKLTIELTGIDKPYTTRDIMDIYTTLDKRVDDIRKELEQRYVALLDEQKRQSILN